MMDVVTVSEGAGPIILAQPHGGTFVPDDLMRRLNTRGQGLDDTDWHITRLYDGLLDDVTVVRSNIHRYVIDANRDPAGVSLYPGQNTTTLCPTTDFDGQDIWCAGQAPSTDEIETRRQTYHAPYHAALATELARVKAAHGFAVLYDCHSIRSNIPFLFEGQLPVFNIGTNGGTTCASEIEQSVHAICQDSLPQSTVLNGRFKGGWTTRHYGRPAEGQHAVQMELAQRAYMDEVSPWAYRTNGADRLRTSLRQILTTLHHLAMSGELNAARGTAHV